jgi:DNA-binding beta-propeller fold protein YncE
MTLHPSILHGHRGNLRNETFIMFATSTALKTTAGLLLALGAACPSMAQGTFYVVTSDSRLGTVNISTGAYSNIGNLGTQLTDIAVAPDGSLYGVSFDDLYSINAVTGAASLIGNTGQRGINALVFQNNTLYAASNFNTGLYGLSLTTGAATFIGDTGFDSAGDLAFDNRGDLYLSSTTNQLIRINAATGAGIAVGNFGVGNGDMFGLAFQPSGLTLYGYSAQSNRIVTIDRATGTVTAVAINQGPQYFGTAFLGEASVSSAPEPGTLCLALLGLPGLTAVGIIRRRRRG